MKTWDVVRGSEAFHPTRKLISPGRKQLSVFNQLISYMKTFHLNPIEVVRTAERTGAHCPTFKQLNSFEGVLSNKHSLPDKFPHSLTGPCLFWELG